MNTKSVLIFSFALALCAAFVSCQKDDDDAKGKMNVSFVMKKKSASLVATNSLVFTSGSLSIKEIEFDGDYDGDDDDDDDDDSLIINGSQASTIDLISGIATPKIELGIPANEYTDIELEVDILDSDKPGIVAEAIYTDAAGAKIPVKFEFNSGDSFEVDLSGYNFTADGTAIVKIDFSPAEWFASISNSMLDNAKKTNGVILVNESNNVEIYNIVKDKLDDLTEGSFE